MTILKRISLVFLAFLICIISSTGSEKTDSLMSVLHMSAEANRLDIYEQIGQNYSRINSDSALKYYEIALELAKESNDESYLHKINTDFGDIYMGKRDGNSALPYYMNALNCIDTNIVSAEVLKAYSNVLYAYYYVQDYNKAVFYSEKADSLLIQLNDTLRQASNALLVGNIAYRKGNYKDANMHYQKAYIIYQSLDSKLGISATCMLLGEVYTKFGNYEAAMRYFDETVPISKEMSDTVRLAGTYLRLGNMFSEWKKYDEAEKNHRRAKALYEAIDDNFGIAAAKNNLAFIHKELGESRKAILLFKELIPIHEALGSTDHLGITIQNIGTSYYDMDMPDSALHYLTMSQKIFREIKHEHNLAFGYKCVALVYIKLERYEEAEALLNKSLDYGLEHDEYELIISSRQAYTELYDKTGNYELAYKHLRESTRLNDSIFNKETHDKFSQIHASYESERKEREIALLTSEKELQAAMLRDKDIAMSRQRIALLVSALVFILILALLIVLFAQMRRKNRAYIKLEKYNREIIEGRKLLIEAKEKAEKMEKLKSAFISNISHEIRTPMAVILGYANLLHSEEYSKEQKTEFTNLINSNGENLMSIIDDILDIAKIESGQLSNDPENFNLDELLQELRLNFDQYKAKLGKEETGIEYIVPYSDLLIHTDKGKLKQVFSNLIHNAIKFTEKGKIEYGWQEKDGGRVYYVKDNGIGIPVEDQPYIFERFRQVDNSTTRKYGGTGLGLAIVKNLVKILDGDIWCSSKPGIGTTFYFTIGDSGTARTEKIFA